MTVIINFKQYIIYFSGFTIANGVPKVGQLLSAAWNVDATCRFKILPAGTHVSNTNTDKRESNGNGSTTVVNKPNHKETADRLDMPPPPSPASSTCSDTGSITTSHSKIQLKIICLIIRNVFKYCNTLKLKLLLM